MELFINVILPIMTVFGSGYLLQRIRVLDVKSIAPVSIYIFLPALVFTSLYDASLDKGYGIIIIFAFILLFLMIAINKVLAWVFGWSQSIESASILTTAFLNGGNYGVPVILFSVGEEALPYAIFYMVLQSVIMNFFGVYYASRSTEGFTEAFKTIFKMPATYAALLAFVMQPVAWEIPASFESILSMLGDAAIPLMMVLLGMQLASITSLRFNWKVLVSATTLRMIISPMIAIAFIWLIGTGPIVSAVLVIVSAMPSAATTTMFAIEFDTEPDLVSSITLMTTLMSIITVTVLLQFIV